ncbi:MAG: hypothetical protein ACHP9T_06940 [Caulobacterales bacterium]|jgi:hypothetical protein
MIGAVLVAGALFAQAAPSAAQAPAARTASGTPNVVAPVTVERKRAPDAAAKEVVCHTEPVLGSLFPKKICASREAFAERRREDQEQLREWSAIKPLKSN